MEYSKEDLAKVKKILTEMLSFFDDFCEKNGLKYYACAGTCLGAVRHKGFIPWDDDIDVVMPRKDYEKIIALKDALKKSGYEINDLSNKGYVLPYAKFCEAKTTLVDSKERPFLMGQFIDIFPLDEVEDTDYCRKLFSDKSKTMRRYAYCFCHFSLKDIFKERNIKELLKRLFFATFRVPLKAYFMKKYEHTDCAIRRQRGNFLMYYGGYYGFEKEFHNKEWFGDGVRVPFENGSVIIPKDFDSYLTKIYKDYMMLPPLEKRVSHHYHYFYDLNKRWTLKDVMKLHLENQNVVNYRYE